MAMTDPGKKLIGYQEQSEMPNEQVPSHPQAHPTHDRSLPSKRPT